MLPGWIGMQKRKSLARRDFMSPKIKFTGQGEFQITIGLSKFERRSSNCVGGENREVCNGKDNETQRTEKSHPSCARRQTLIVLRA